MEHQIVCRCMQVVVNTGLNVMNCLSKAVLSNPIAIRQMWQQAI